MGKRQSHGDFAAGPRKRPRIVHEAPTSEDINTARQLGQLLAFEQDPKTARHGLQSFKLFLDELLSDREDHPDRFKLLKDYLQSTAPPASEDEENRVYLRDIMQTWDFASETSNDNLLSAVVVALALLLKLLSQKLDMVPFGLGICRTLLQKRHLELISRNLSADKGKAFIISPTLRLLKEAVSFDGGAVAKPIFRARAFTLKSLARNMGIVHIGDEDEEAAKRPSPRTNAVLFFLSALKLLHPEAKKELLQQRDVVTALTREVKQDPQYLLVELLSTLRDHVILDDKLPREAKSALLGGGTLMRLSTLYYYRQNATADEKLPSIPDMVHEFLLSACTIPSCGILRSDFGFYPGGDDTFPTTEVDLETGLLMGQSRNEAPVRNYVISTFLPHLRPWSSTKQSELVIAIFKVAPELLADYFIKHKSFTFDPKLSATWIGYSTFLFQAVMLPLPKFLGGKSGFQELPPPTSIVIDNILPLPLNQKVLTRCLAHKSKIISFFATRILVLSIQKLDSAVKMYQTASQVNKALWDNAARSLVDEFCQRSPGIKDVINPYRAIPEEDILHREAGSLLLRLYYDVLPRDVFSAKFDVSPFLETALGRLSKSRPEDPRDLALSMKELENLLAIAGYSPGMRWFSSSDSELALSPFTSLLKVYTEAPQGLELPKVREVLDSVAVDHQVVATYTSHSGLLPLLRSVQALQKSEPKCLVSLWSFLDNCLMRCASAPVKYGALMQNMLEEIGESPEQSGDTGPTSFVPFAALEQLPFVVKNGDPDTLRALEKFFPVFLDLLVAAGESKGLLEAVLQKISTSLGKDLNKLPSSKSSRLLLLEESDPLPRPQEGVQDTESDLVNEHEPVFEATDSDMTDEELEQMLDSSDTLSVDTSALMKWPSKTVDEMVDEGYAVSLISLLVSEHASIRKEAVTNILKMAGRIKQSEYEEKEQIWLLLSELAETAKSVRLETDQLPGPIVAFAGHAIRMLKDPLSVLYPKINSFLTRGPVWRLDKLPLVEEVLEEEPSIGEPYYNQLSWLLSYLLAGLRTEQDLELFRKKRAKGPILERLLILASTIQMRLPLRIQILQLLYRVTKIKGGATMLTTRCGVLSWLDQQRGFITFSCSAGLDNNDARINEALKRRVLQTGDQERITEWCKAQEA